MRIGRGVFFVVPHLISIKTLFSLSPSRRETYRLGERVARGGLQLFHRFLLSTPCWSNTSHVEMRIVRKRMSFLYLFLWLFFFGSSDRVVTLLFIFFCFSRHIIEYVTRHGFDFYHRPPPPGFSSTNAAEKRNKRPVRAAGADPRRRLPERARELLRDLRRTVPGPAQPQVRTQTTDKCCREPRAHRLKNKRSSNPSSYNNLKLAYFTQVMAAYATAAATAAATQANLAKMLFQFELCAAAERHRPQGTTLNLSFLR